jgi:hypothetical protein
MFNISIMLKKTIYMTYLYIRFDEAVIILFITPLPPLLPPFSFLKSGERVDYIK